MTQRFEWDETKAMLNMRKHGVSFEMAATVYTDALAYTFKDPDHSIGEERMLTFGYASDGRLLAVVHTER